MAVTAVGFSPTVDEVGWSKLLLRGFEGGYRHVVWSGGTVTSGTGRAVNVSVIDAEAAGVWFLSDAVTSVALDANPGTNKRIDYIIAEANWGGTTSALGTPTRSVAITKVTGVAAANPAAPNLTQTGGSLWQIPLARVTVPAAATTIPAGNIEICKPIRRAVQRITVADLTADNFSNSADNKVQVTVPIPDPGWPYVLDYRAAMIFSGDSGYARMRVRLDGNIIGTTKSAVMTTNSGDVHAFLNRFSDVTTGTHTLDLTVSAEGVAAGFPFSTAGGGANYLQVLQIPA